MFAPRNPAFASLRQLAYAAVVVATVLGPQLMAAPPAPAPRNPAPPDPVVAHYQAAQTYQLAGQTEQSQLEYQAMLGLTLDRVGNLKLNQADYPRAQELLQEAIRLQPANAELRVDHAILLLRQEKFDAARLEAEAALRLQPENARAHHVLGKALFATGDLPNAVKHLEQAAALQPDFDAAYTLGVAYLKVKETGKAQAVFDALLNSAGAVPQLYSMFGFGYYSAGYPEEAAAQFRKAIALNPKHPKAHYFLGLIELNRLDEAGFPAAKQEFEKEIAVNPGDFQSQFLLGYINSQEKNTEAAEAHLKAAAALDRSPDPLIYLGQLYVDAGRDAEAEQSLRQAIMLTADPARNNYQISRAHYLLGRLLAAQGKRDEGTAELKEYERLRNLAVKTVSDEREHPGLKAVVPTAGAAAPLDARQIVQAPATAHLEDAAAQQYEQQVGGMIAEAYNNLGVIAAQGKDFDAALANFRSSAKWAPEPDTLQRNWGTAAFLAEKYEEAIPALEKYLQRTPDDPRAQSRLATSYFVTEKYALAVKAFQPMAGSLDADPAQLYAYGVSLVKTGEVKQGVELLQRAATASPDSASIHLLLGQAYADQGDVESAAAEFQRTLAIDPQKRQAHFQYGLLLLRKGRLTEAEAQFRAELVLDPASVSARYHLGLALLDDQKKEEAARLLNEVVQADPSYAEAFYQLGKMQLEQDDLSGALKNLAEAARLAPAESHVHYQLGLAYRRAGRQDEAANELKLYETLKAKSRGRADASPK